MAVRFDVSTDGYRAQTGLPTSGVWTFICWLKIVVDRNVNSGLWALLNSGGSKWLNLYTNADGTTLSIEDSVNYISTRFANHATVVGTWYCMGFSVSGTTGNLYIGTDPDAMTTYSAANFNDTGAVVNMYLGKDDGTTYFNGCLTNVKLFSAALSQSEIIAELKQYSAVRSTNLLHRHPFTDADLNDYSGGGFTLTAGTTTPGVESGPPILQAEATKNSGNMLQMRVR
jgi:hypothetical protein